MNETNIRKYATLMNELGLTGLEIKEKDSVVRLERMVQSAPAAVTVTQTAPAAVPAEKDDGGYVSVRSPMVGVFYSAPAEDKDPFVKVGDRIKQGSTLCIIEAMKLMNEISADADGEIAEICVKNGQVVDYGCELFRIKR